jgi:tetratricopeptide (TPR) repeat protein
MKAKHFVAGLSLAALLSGCATFDSSGDISEGRNALFRGDYQTALGYFQRADQVDPNYVFGTEVKAGPLSYVGRAQYLSGNYAQAAQTLQKALAQHSDDSVARLYLGLALVREGDRQQGLQEIDAGLKGVDDLIHYVRWSYRFSFGKWWDAGGNIRSVIANDRAMIASGNIDWQKLLADGEWVALRIDREPEAVRDQREDVV